MEPLRMTGDIFQNQGPRRRRRSLYLVPVLVVLPFVAVAVFAALVASSSPSIRVGASSLAEVSLPLGGGKVTQVVAVGGREQQVVPVRLEGDQVLPTKAIPAGERVTVEATIQRPGWISWLAGKTERVQVTETTPVAHLASTFITRHGDQPMNVGFSAPVAAAGYGALGRHVSAARLSQPADTLAMTETKVAGTAQVAFAARSWETPTVASVSWFPAGTKASAVATPAPGGKITPSTDITLTFSKPVTKALDGTMPPVTPRGAGAWQTVNPHTIRFVPAGYGYGLGADVRVSLPAGVDLIGGKASGGDPVGQWTVPDGSTLALQQLLAQLGYLPVNFTPATGAPATASTTAAEEAAVLNPPKGTFSWRYPSTPSLLRSMWAPGASGELTRGAVMAFEENQGLTTDGVAGPEVWKALINAAVKNQKSTFGYTFVMVSENSPESEEVWHNGKIVVSGPVNTGISAAPTATGTYAVYEHIPSGTMSGTNPDGSTYHDPGIPYISYFNGGDALHGFIRASYGFPQSLGCVEMPYSEAGQVYPYTPIGTIVNVAS